MDAGLVSHRDVGATEAIRRDVREPQSPCSGVLRGGAWSDPALCLDGARVVEDQAGFAANSAGTNGEEFAKLTGWIPSERRMRRQAEARR
jgi:hypothetical protein